MLDFDFSNLIKGVQPEKDPNEGSSVLPSGRYNVRIERVESKSNDKGWKGINLMLRVISKSYNNAVLFDLVTIANTAQTEGQQKAIEIGLSRVKKISELSKSANPKNWIGKEFGVAVGLVDDQYLINKGELEAKKNIVWGYTDKYDMDKGDNGQTTTDSPQFNPEFSNDEIPF